MTDETDPETADGSGASTDGVRDTSRETAPMSPYDSAAVGLGLLVLLVGLVVAFGVPLLGTL
ncbi:DUF7550 family protein [Halovivax limisalsi]|uniref:DUF7550 family protein n=1 Tax=Halovivax limisalsi TaxID=1453760 RepID=UPI001FFDC39E|nr:hypothetical protein [Halovivax limisalsi]